MCSQVLETHYSVAFPCRQKKGRKKMQPVTNIFSALTASLSPEQDCTKAQQETSVLVPFHSIFFLYHIWKILPIKWTLLGWSVSLLLQCVNGRTVTIIDGITWYFSEQGSVNVYWAPEARKQIWPHLSTRKVCVCVCVWQFTWKLASALISANHKICRTPIGQLFGFWAQLEAESSR